MHKPFVQFESSKHKYDYTGLPFDLTQFEAQQFTLDTIIYIIFFHKKVNKNKNNYNEMMILYMDVNKLLYDNIMTLF